MMNNKMTVTAHLGELRKTVVIIAVAILICSALMLLVSGKILSGFTNLEGYTFVYTSPEMIATQQIKIAVICGIIISLPISICALWHFICPALSKRERKISGIVLVFGLLLFIGGAVFAYTVIFPVMIRFFKSIECAPIQAYISIAEYVNFMITVCVIFGIAFELPIVMVCLEKMGVVQRKFFERMRKYAIAVIFIVAALVTPSDIFSMVITAVPLILIYEIGIIVIKMLNRC
jgi:sec-independent protein translocase protein TatC